MRVPVGGKCGGGFLINRLQLATINWGGSGRDPSDSCSLSSILKMGRSTHALLFLLLLLCSAAMALSTKDIFGEDLGLSLATREENHKHSGFSQAECPGACQFRCSKTAYKKPCMFFCQKCCFKCKCVPPGTYAHKEVCPCYNNWKTKRGGPKCP